MMQGWRRKPTPPPNAKLWLRRWSKHTWALPDYKSLWLNPPTPAQSGSPHVRRKRNLYVAEVMVSGIQCETKRCKGEKFKSSLPGFASLPYLVQNYRRVASISTLHRFWNHIQGIRNPGHNRNTTSRPGPPTRAFEAARQRSKGCLSSSVSSDHNPKGRRIKKSRVQTHPSDSQQNS